MEITRFIIAGNVDDGKSTLTGRLLHDAGGLKADALTAATAGDQLNLAHIADGLRAEREQGITMDVAYKYFTTARRKYIVIDAPGHFKYTHNLVTGASGANVMVIMADAMLGVTEQTRRHALVASFLGMRQVVVAINKMDLVAYDADVFDKIRQAFSLVAAQLSLEHITYIPLSALHGDNVVAASARMPWYSGATLLQYLDDADTGSNFMDSVRFAVQYVIDTPGGKGYAGMMYTGHISVGMGTIIYPGPRPAFITKMIHGFTQVEHAIAGQSLTIFLDRGNAGRGDILTCGMEMTQGARLRVLMWWLDADATLQCNKQYLLRMHTSEVSCTILAVTDKIDIHSLAFVPPGDTLRLNDVAHVLLETHEPVACDTYIQFKATGRGILIDKETKSTLAAFVVEGIQ